MTASGPPPVRPGAAVVVSIPFMDIDRPTSLVEQINLRKRDRDRILTANAVRLFRL